MQISFHMVDLLIFSELSGTVQIQMFMQERANHVVNYLLHGADSEFVAAGQGSSSKQPRTNISSFNR